MAKDVKFIIAASVEKAEAEIKKLQQTGQTTADRLSQSFEQLGIRSTMAIEQERAASTAAYEKIKASGVASAEELSRAKAALAKKEQALDEEIYGKKLSLMEETSQTYAKLGIRSSAAIEQERAAATAAYEKIKASGVASSEELSRAKAALAQKEQALDGELYGKKTSLMQKFKANWLAVTAAIGAAWLLVSQSWQMAMDSAQGMQERTTFQNLAASHGQAADKIIADLKAVSGETINTKTLVEKAGTAMVLGIPADKLSGLMEIARASARVTGQSITKSFEDISLGVARQSRLILDNLGLIISEEQANKDYAASLGKTAEQLTDAEKRTAFMNATMAAGADMIKRVGLNGETMAEKMQRVSATMDNMKETVGRGILAVLAVLNGAFQGAAATALALSAGIFKIISATAGLVGAKETMKEYQINSEAAMNAARDLAKKGMGSLSDAAFIVSGKYGEANGKLAAFQNQAKLAAEAAQKLSEVKKAGVEALGNYAKAVDKVGEAQRKSAASGFADDLKKQASYLKENGQLIGNLSGPIEKYLSVVNAAYGQQLDIQKAIGQALFSIGAEQKAIAQQNIQIAEVEKAAAGERLVGWTQYYENLKGMHAAAMDTMKKRQQELFDIRMTTGDLALQVQQKMMTPMEQYYSTVARLEEKQRIASTLGSDEKIKMLQQVQQQYANLTSEIKDGDQVLLTQTEAASASLAKIQSIGAQLEKEKASQINQQAEVMQSLELRMKEAAAQVETLHGKIRELDATIAALTRTFTLSIDDQASPAVAQIKSALDSIRDKTVVVSMVYDSVYSSSGSPSIPSYDVGTPYVPKTGLALIHKGERIVTASDNAKGNYGGGTSITIPGGINVTVQGGASAEVGAEIGRQAWATMEELAQSRKTA